MKPILNGRIKIEGREMLRDLNSKALLNRDLAGLNAYKDKKKMMEDIQLFQDEINNIKSDITEIKQLLIKLATKE